MDYIPIMTKPYPDEMLYSWFYRLSEMNGLSLSIFGKAFLGFTGIYSGEFPVEVRHEYVRLCEKMLYEGNNAQTYLDHSTLRFNALFMPQKKIYRYVNSITLHRDELNPPYKSLSDHIYACPECIKEDRKIYGTAYLHVSHNIGGVKFCKKHRKPLQQFHGPHFQVCEFDLDHFTPVPINTERIVEYEYACFVYELYNSGINCYVEDIKSAAIARMTEMGYSVHGEGYNKLEEDFNRTEYTSLSDKTLRYCFDNYMIKKKAYPCRDFIPLLLFLFGSVPVLTGYLINNEPVMKSSVCNNCGKTYLSLCDERYSMGLCPDCYTQVPLQERFDSLISVSNDDEYHAVTQFESMNGRVDIKHSCGNITSAIPRNFIYGEGRCICERYNDDVWNAHFSALKRYKAQYNTANVPKRYKYKDFSLGLWCQKMRNDKANGVLSIEREIALLDIGFDFTPFDTAWNRIFDIYKDYVNETGNSYVSRGVAYKGIRLGEWYNNNRRHCIDGKMNQDRIDKFKAVYPDFPNIPEKPVKEEKPHKKIVRFEEAVELLLRYERENGTMNIPKRKEYGGYKLGIWANQMRSKRRQGILPVEQIERLNDIGFDWNPLQTKWNGDIERYKRYVRETSVTEIPKEATYDGFAIGYWYSNLKISRKNGSLTDNQIADITKINPSFMRKREQGYISVQ